MSSVEGTGRIARTRARAARARRRRPLEVTAIVDVALRIVDEEGVEAVSMRRVAAEFDTGPASLYAHVANKDALLHLVLERVIDEVPLPEGADWQQVVRRYAHDVRAVFARHNDVARLTFGTVPSGPNMMNIGERVLSSMIGAGVPPQVATWALDVLALYVASDVFEGWLMGKMFDDGSGRPAEEIGKEYFEGVAQSFASLDPRRYPTIVGNLRYLMNGDGDDRFAFAVDMLIAGFAAQIGRQQR